MVFQILNVIEKEINSQIKYAFGISEDVVIFSNIVDQSGNKALQQDNIIHFTLLRIEEDKTINKVGGYQGQFGRNTPTLFNLYVLFSASHSGKQYPDGVNLIGWILQYFITNFKFTQTELPNLPNEVDSITFELQNTDIRDLSNLWGSLGSKLLPHVCYKIGLIPLYRDGNINSTGELIKGIGKNLDGF
jgi:hypothetical protein